MQSNQVFPFPLPPCLTFFNKDHFEQKVAHLCPCAVYMPINALRISKAADPAHRIRAKLTHLGALFSFSFSLKKSITFFSQSGFTPFWAERKKKKSLRPCSKTSHQFGMRTSTRGVGDDQQIMVWQPPTALGANLCDLLHTAELECERKRIGEECENLHLHGVFCTAF